MTAEERAAVEWLESVDPLEHAEHFVPPYGSYEFFTLKRDHEGVSATGTCYACRGAEERGDLVVIE